MLIRPPDPPLINSPLVFEFRFESRIFFFLSIIAVAISVFDHANHTLKKMKSSRIQWVSFYAQIAYCLKTEALVVRSILSIS